MKISYLCQLSILYSNSIVCSLLVNHKALIIFRKWEKLSVLRESQQ